MATKHFSLPDKVLAWIEKRAKERGMRRSQFLVHELMKLMEAEEQAK